VVGFIDRTPRDDRTMAEAAVREALARGALPAGAEWLVPAIGDNSARMEVVDLAGPFLAPTLVHPAAWVSPSAVLGAGTVVLPNALVQTGAEVGRGVIVHVGAIVDHHGRVGDGVYLAQGSIICGAGTVDARSSVPPGTIVQKGERYP
jgi:UDP-N-acetylbacillosamine N-acetyltransferase